MDDGTPQWNYKLKQTIIDFDIFFRNEESVSRSATLTQWEKMVSVAGALIWHGVGGHPGVTGQRLPS